MFTRVTSRIPVTASSKSKCESTVITGYGSTQDDEHLCWETKSEPVLCGLQVLEEKSTTTYVHTYIVGNYVTTEMII